MDQYLRFGDVMGLIKCGAAVDKDESGQLIGWIQIADKGLLIWINRIRRGNPL